MCARENKTLKINPENNIFPEKVRRSLLQPLEHSLLIFAAVPWLHYSVMSGTTCCADNAHQGDA